MAFHATATPLKKVAAVTNTPGAAVATDAAAVTVATDVTAEPAATTNAVHTYNTRPEQFTPPERGSTKRLTKQHVTRCMPLSLIHI